MTEFNYEFEELPLEGVDPGTTVLVTGPTHGGTRDLGLRLLSGSADEGAIVVTTNWRATRVAEDCRRVGIRVASDRTAIVDCVGETNSEVPARVLPVSGPNDLTGIGMRFSDVYREFREGSIEEVRTGVFSVSTLLSFGNLRTVSRFVHTLVGRIDSVDGFGVLLVDPSIHDDRTVGTISQFCTGTIEFRETDGGHELRTRGLSRNIRNWTSFDPRLD